VGKREAVRSLERCSSSSHSLLSCRPQGDVERKKRGKGKENFGRRKKKEETGRKGTNFGYSWLRHCHNTGQLEEEGGKRKRSKKEKKKREGGKKNFRRDLQPIFQVRSQRKGE